jgi:hypothetical protein
MVADVFPKIGHFTMDNASNNETMMKSLERRLAAREIAFDAAERKIMCYGHIIDLSSGHVIRSVSAAVNYGDGSESDDPSQAPPHQTAPIGDEAANATSDPIVLARAVVRSIRGSGQRRDAFDEVITNGNAKGWFKIGDPPTIVVLKHLQLLRDVCTRWDSVFHMLNRLRALRPVFLFISSNIPVTEQQIYVTGN